MRSRRRSRLWVGSGSIATGRPRYWLGDLPYDAANANPRHPEPGGRGRRIYGFEMAAHSELAYAAGIAGRPDSPNSIWGWILAGARRGARGLPGAAAAVSG